MLDLLQNDILSLFELHLLLQLSCSFTELLDLFALLVADWLVQDQGLELPYFRFEELDLPLVVVQYFFEIFVKLLLHLCGESLPILSGEFVLLQFVIQMINLTLLGFKFVL